MKPLALVLVATALAAPLALAYNTVVARELGRVAYAEFATGLAMATMLAYAGGALAPITAHLAARYMAAGTPEKIRGLVATLLRRMIPLLGGGALVIAVLATPIARAFHFESSVSVIAAYCVLAGLLLLSIVRSASRGAQQFSRFGAGVVGEAIIRLAVGMGLVVVWPRPAAALAGYAAALLATFAWTFHGLRRVSEKTTPIPRTDVTGLLGTTTALVVAMAAFQNIDILIVKRSFAAADAGVYAAAWSFARWMSLVAFPIEALLLPRLSFEGERGRSVAAVTAQLGGSMMVLGAIPLTLFILIPRLIVTSLYGDQYQDAAPLLFSLGLAAFAQYACYLTVQVLIARTQIWPVIVFAMMGVAETAIITVRHDSLQMVATVLVLMRLAALAMILVTAAVRARPRAAMEPA